MKHTSILLSSILFCALAACGGGDDSGLSDSKVVGTLTADEAMALCTELAGDFPERTVDCGGGVMITVGLDAADCDASQPPATCTATVGNYRDCFDALDGLSDAQWCDENTPLPQACAPVFSAGCTGQ